jgi:hypothetical protein
MLYIIVNKNSFWLVQFFSKEEFSETTPIGIYLLHWKLQYVKIPIVNHFCEHC